MLNNVSSLNCKPIKTPHTSFGSKNHDEYDDFAILRKERSDLINEMRDKEDMLDDSIIVVDKARKIPVVGKLATPVAKAGEIVVYAGAGYFIGKAKFLRGIVDVVANSVFKAAERLTEKTNLRGELINFVIDKTEKLLDKKVVAKISESINAAQAKASIAKEAKAALKEGEKLTADKKLTKKETFLNILGKFTKPLREKFVLNSEAKKALIEATPEYKAAIEKGISAEAALAEVLPQVSGPIKKAGIGQGINSTLKVAAGTVGAGYGAYKGVTTPLDEFPDKVKKEFKDAMNVLALNGNG